MNKIVASDKRSTDLVLNKFSSGKLSNLRPEDMKKAIEYSIRHDIPFVGSLAFNTATEHLINEFHKRSGRYAESTVKRLKLAWKVFLDWCIDHEHESLPASASTVEAFFVDKANSHHRNSLAVFKWAIAKIHHICGCPDPMSDIFVNEQYLQLRQKKVRSMEAIKQAIPFNEDHLEAITEKLNANSDLMTRRNIALLTVGYETMLRASEVARIKISDLKWKEDGTVRIQIPYTKTNKTGKPEVTLLSYHAALEIKRYMDAANLSELNDSYLFIPLTKHNKSVKPKLNEIGDNIYTPISTKTIENVYRWASKVLGHQVNLSSHSARVGAAQDLLKKGYSLPQIQQSGRWTSPEMVTRYGSDILAEESAMAQSRRKPR